MLPPRYRLVPILMALAISSAAGCTTIQSIETTELRRGAKPNRAGEAVMLSKASEPTRLGPDSRVRVWRSNGTLSPWVYASRLRVTDEGLLMEHQIPFGFVDGVRVSGLRERDLDYLESVAPGGCVLADRNDKVVVLEGCEGRFAEWIDAYLVGVHTVWEDEIGYMSPETCRELTHTPDGGNVDPWYAATNHLMCLQRLRGVKSWNFHVSGLGWLDDYDDHNLNRAVRGGLSHYAGLRWEDVASAEVRNESLWNIHGPEGPPPPEEIGLWGQTFASPTGGVSSPHLFDTKTRRRAGAIFGLSLGADSTFSDSHLAAGNIAAFLRLGRMLDLGGGYLQHVAMNEAGDIERRHAGFFRLGTHLDLNAGRDFALALFMDIGGGGPIKSLHRYHGGLRWHVTDGVHLGLYPFNPQRILLAEDYEGSLVEGWSFPTRLELSWWF
jgi:hypothetical protein